VSRSIIRQEIKSLVDDGMVWQTPGKGTFSPPIKRSRYTLRRLRGFFHDVADEGLTPKSTVLEIKFILIHGKISNIFQLEEGATVLFLNRLRDINNEPMMISRTHIPINHISAQLANEDFENNSLYEIIEKIRLHDHTSSLRR
jgi:GntR family transcriptional regulator